MFVKCIPLADALDERIEIAGLSNVSHVRSDFAALPIKPASLDVILLAQILHDFANNTDAGAIALLRVSARFSKKVAP